MFSLYKEKKNHHSDNNKIQVEHKPCRSSEAHTEEWSSQASWLGRRRLLHRGKKVWETPSTTGDNSPFSEGRLWKHWWTTVQEAKPQTSHRCCRSCAQGCAPDSGKPQEQKYTLCLNDFPDLANIRVHRE